MTQKVTRDTLIPCLLVYFKLFLLVSVSISYSNYRISLHDTKDEDVDSNVDDGNRDIDRFVVSAAQ